MKYLLIFWGITSALFLASRLKLRKYDRFAAPVPWNPTTRSEIFLLAAVIFAVLPGMLVEVIYETMMFPRRKAEEDRRWREKLNRGC